MGLRRNDTHTRSSEHRRSANDACHGADAGPPFGELLVLALLRRHDQEGAAFVPRYLELLAAGGSESPPALLRRIGLELEAFCPSPRR